MPAIITDCQCIFTGNCPKNTCVVPHFDTAGVAVDPFDRTAIWMTHIYANATGSASMAVGKVFGATYPDVITSQVDFSPQKVNAGNTVQIKYTLHNGGDGPASDIKVNVRLVPLAALARPEIWVAQDEQIFLASGATINKTLPVTLPANLLDRQLCNRGPSSHAEP